MLEDVWPELAKAFATGVPAGGAAVGVRWIGRRAVRASRRLRPCDAWCRQGAIAAEFVDLGPQGLKNIAEPAHVYAIAPAA